MIQKTSLEAYQVLIPDLGNQQETVYNTITEHPDSCNHELAKLLGWEINRVTPRVKELRDKGLVVCTHTKIDNSTNRSVMCWKTV